MSEPSATNRPAHPAPSTIGPTTFRWGARTFVMGIINVTPDSFSGDGVLAATRRTRAGTTDALDPVEVAVASARRMVAEGADILDVGGESTRPGHQPVSAEEERRRVVPVIAALRAALPNVPLSVDTTKPAVAEAALAAGADLINDVWGVGRDDALPRLAAANRIPLVVMHNRAEARYARLLPEVMADLQAALERALRLGVRWDDLIVDPGFGFGKTPEQNLELMRELGTLRTLGRPILLGTSRKSTLGRVLDLGPEQRLEATLATTALAIAGGADMVRVHDVRANVRAARISDAIIRANWRSEPAEGGPS
ncbi:MAG: dihydropteroate synthase [Candidatus Limnocylindrales bacterium]|nr:dihydropteroate synthase [Candidatus Limnocylindrales bacterium]